MPPRKRSRNLPITIEIVPEHPPEAKMLIDQVFDNLDRQLLGATFQELFDRFPKGEVTLLAKTESGQLVGTTRFVYSGGLGEIHSLVVDSAFQRQGVGTAILKRAEDLAKELRLHALTLTAPNVLSHVSDFYGRHGYKKTATIPFGRLGFDWMIFTKELHIPRYSWLE